MSLKLMKKIEKNSKICFSKNNWIVMKRCSKLMLALCLFLSSCSYIGYLAIRNNSTTSYRAKLVIDTAVPNPYLYDIGLSTDNTEGLAMRINKVDTVKNWRDKDTLFFEIPASKSVNLIGWGNCTVHSLVKYLDLEAESRKIIIYDSNKTCSNLEKTIELNESKYSCLITIKK